jgi:hypothetical protein
MPQVLQPITTSSTGLTLSRKTHGDTVLLINTNSSGTSTFTLPTANGSGTKFRLVNNVQQTQGTLVVTGAVGDTLVGKAIMLDSTAAADAMVFMTTATTIKTTWNRTTQGGLGYDEIEAIDVAANVYEVVVTCNASGTIITPFSS